LGAVFFAFQIYGDFSGYSDIAIGTARLFGFDLMRNFNFPYFSRDIAEFWRRWHISLTTWFRDYIYIPLGGSRVSKRKVIRNTFIIFLVSGFWHGANWTFVAWGAYHAILFLPLILSGKNRKYTDTVSENTMLPNMKELFQMGITFTLVVLGWVLFRAENMSHAWNYLSEIFSSSLFSMPTTRGLSAFKATIFIPIFLIIEWLGRSNQYAIEKLGLTWKKPLRWSIYYCIVVAIIMFSGESQDFIYFQF
jgi:D-alanyl-lipoteichoic acid acyltransferase DltB (MBOAT superfamily)